MKIQQGFTLIELMIAVAIVAILSAIAIPAYQDYTMRSKIPQATSILANKRVQMEQYFQDNLTYVGATACNSDTTSSTYFNFDCSAGAASINSYTLTATGKGAMAGFTYTIDQNNSKQTRSAPSGWAAPSMPASCWITKKGGTC